MVIRCMEDEFVLPNNNSVITGIHLASHYRGFLSEMWVGLAYSIFWVINKRKCLPKDDMFEDMFEYLKYLRIPLEKREIASDWKLKEPLKMQFQPTIMGAQSEYTYHGGKNPDMQRAHIMPTGISDRGSTMWQVTDIERRESYWIERRRLSEMFLSLPWSKVSQASNSPQANDT